MLKLSKLLLALSTMIAISGCGVKDEETELSDNLARLAQSALSTVGQAASSTEGSSALFSSSVGTLATCGSSNVSSCSGDTKTISWNSCTSANGNVTLTGGWNITYQSGQCSASSTLNPLPDGTNLTMQTQSTGSTAANSLLSIKTTTDTATAWDGTSIGGGTVISRSGTTRSITINGVHRVATTSRGKTLFNHSLRTPSSIQVTGSKALGTRQITSGSLAIYHNIAQYTATHTFSGLTWGQSSCSCPTTGTISVTFSNTSGTATFAFSSCGQGTYTSTSGVQSEFSIDHCE